MYAVFQQIKCYIAGRGVKTEKFFRRSSDGFPKNSQAFFDEFSNNS